MLVHRYSIRLLQAAAAGCCPAADGSRRRQQAEEGGAVERAEHGGAEQRVLGGARLDVGVVEFLHAAVEAAEAAGHAFLPQQLDGRADGQDEEGEEEVHHVLARLREQQPLRLPVDEELHAQRRRRVGGCHRSGKLELSTAGFY
jgi:hypothetical protein